MQHPSCNPFCLFMVPFCSWCVFFAHQKDISLSSKSPAAAQLVETSWIEFPQDSVSTQYVVTDEDDTSVSACCETKPQSRCYVFPIDGESCIVITVDSLMLLDCSMWFPSTLFSSVVGSWKPFSEAGSELVMLPDTELTPMVLSGTLLWPVDCDIFGRGLEPPLAPRTLDACVRLLYVFRMMRRMARMMMIPMTMTAIIAPELWMSICSFVFVTAVVFEGTVVLVTGETVEACIFSNNQTVSSLISAQAFTRWEPEQKKEPPPSAHWGGHSPPVRGWQSLPVCGGRHKGVEECVSYSERGNKSQVLLRWQSDRYTQTGRTQTKEKRV